MSDALERRLYKAWDRLEDSVDALAMERGRADDMAVTLDEIRALCEETAAKHLPNPWTRTVAYHDGRSEFAREVLRIVDGGTG